MTITNQQLQEWLNARENEHLEFKEAKNNFHFEKLVKYCAALANEGGGSIVLGVTDTRPRQVVGSQVFPDLQRTKAALIERLRLRIDASEVMHPNGRVLVLTAPSRPIGMPVAVEGAYWMRAGEDLAPMTPDMLRRIFDEAGPDFSAEICPKATLADLDPDATGPADQRDEYRQGFLLYYDKLWETISLRNDLQHYQERFVMHHIPTFREAAVREAILNAVAHRDYRHGGSVFVRQFPRRLEIVSPGGFPSGITPDSIIDKQFPRNRRIAETFLRCGLVERSGQGANRMFEECIRDSKPLPDYSRSDPHEVFLTLHGEMQDPAFILFLNKLEAERGTPFSSHEYLVFDLVRRGEPISKGDRDVLQSLRKLGLIESRGHGRGTRYELSSHYYVATERPRMLDRDAAKALLARFIEEHRDEGSTLADMLGEFPSVSRDQLKTMLKELKAEGKAHSVGRTKGGRWYPGGATK